MGELVVTLRDSTERKALERQLTHQAFHDALRVREDRPDHEVAVVFVDLDDFKQVNDGLGHTAGDEVLESVGLRLRQCVRNGDTLLENRSGLPDVLAATERILQLFALPLRAGRLELAVRASAGVALARPGADRPASQVRERSRPPIIGRQSAGAHGPRARARRRALNPYG